MSKERVLVLNHQYLVDCTHITFCNSKDDAEDYSSVLEENPFRYTFFIKKELIDCIGLELCLLKAIDNFHIMFSVEKEDITINSPIAVGSYPKTKEGIVGKIVNDHMVETSILKWKETNRALELYGPQISEDHLKTLTLLDQLPYYYIESVCFQEFRRRGDRPLWFTEFVRKLKNERLN